MTKMVYGYSMVQSSNIVMIENITTFESDFLEDILINIYGNVIVDNIVDLL